MVRDNIQSLIKGIIRRIVALHVIAINGLGFYFEIAISSDACLETVLLKLMKMFCNRRIII